ncbi:tetratricopeptide repeat protein [Flavobacterium silvaticum]|uniref:Tetratricopeptide repeat protein n=1 Tax=Flavobacterium silvaticum TaxID=1852020 RepID=A0A972FVZ6_9FLAO|nr:tetratricopeptide repeat protein [Flavobacterium silvaticum]NMH28640.1 tetratricopeptide repeat protein [Flavobacterium silvaticum]
MNLRSKFLIILFFLLNQNFLFAQNPSVDSLQNVLKNYPKKDTVRVNLLNKIATKIFASDGDKALKLLKDAESLSDDLYYKQGKAYSLLFSGNIMVNRAEYKTALTYFNNAFEIYKSLRDKEGMANCHFNFGRSYFYLADYTKAEENYKAAIALCEETGDQKRLSASLIGIGTLYSNRGDFDRSMESYQKAVKIDEKIGNKKGVANSLTAMGNIYRKQAKFPLALECYNRSLDIKEKLGEQFGIAVNLNNIGLVNQELDQEKEALAYYERALPIFEKLKNKKEIMATLANIGVIHMNYQSLDKARALFNQALSISRELGVRLEEGNILLNLGTVELIGKNFQPAISYLEKAIAIEQELGNKRELSYAFLKMGQAYFGLKDYEKALAFADKGEAIAKAMHILDYQSDLAKLHSQIYYETKQYKLAYENSEAHKDLKDSIFRKEKVAEVADVKYKYKYKDSLDTANQTVLKKDSEIASTNMQKWGWIAGFAGLLVVLGAVLAYVKIRRVKMQNKQLLTEQKLLRSQMNPHFIFNSLQNVRSLINNGQSDEALNYVTKFSRLTRQILESSDVNYISLEEEIEMIQNYIGVQQLLYDNSFDFELSVDETIDPEATMLPPMLTQPFIENAIKHGLGNKKTDGKIHIGFYLKKDKLFFEVSDNGLGFGTSQTKSGHKSMAMAITKERLVKYTKNESFELQIDNILDRAQNIIGAKVAFEIPYIYEN